MRVAKGHFVVHHQNSLAANRCHPGHGLNDLLALLNCKARARGH